MNREKLWASILVTLEIILVVNYSSDFRFGLAAFSLLIMVNWFDIPIRIGIHLFLSVVALIAFSFEAIWSPPGIRNDWLLPGRFVVAAGKTLIILQLVEIVSGKTNPTGQISVRFDFFLMFCFLISFCRELTDDHRLFFVAVSTGLVFSYPLYRRAKLHRIAAKNPLQAGSRLSQIAGCCCFILALWLGTHYLAKLTNESSSLLRYFLIDGVVQAQEFGSVAKIGYSSSGKLDGIIAFQKINPMSVALDVNCQWMPGYLRGRVFTKFGRYGWQQPFDGMTQIKARPPDEINGLPADDFPEAAVFQIANDSPPPYRFVHTNNDDNHLGDFLFTPLDTSHVLASGRATALDAAKVLRGGLDSRKTYVAAVPKYDSPVEMDDDYFRTTTALPRFFHPSARTFSVGFSKGAESDAAIIAKVESFFQENFTYSLQPPIAANGLDRISSLILNKTPAHCEYFATAAVFMLRVNQIPARYVTGFAVHEGHPEDDGRWLARNRDAHAWVEAYDRQKQKWVIVEPTPGMALPKSVWDQTEEQVQKAAVASLARNENTGSNNAHDFNGLIRRLRFWLNRQLGGELANLCGVLLLSICAVFYFRKSISAFFGASPYRLKEQGNVLRQIDRRLKKHQLERGKSETLHQYAERLSRYTGKNQDWVRSIASRYCEYAEACYCPNIPRSESQVWFAE